MKTKTSCERGAGFFSCVHFFLASLIWLSAIPQGRAEFPPSVINGLGLLSANGSVFQGGDTVIVNVTLTSDYWCQNMILGVPYAVSATLNGEAVPRDDRSYYDHFFDFNPHHNPTGPMYFIALPGGAGSHTATFKLKRGVNAKHTSDVDDNGVTQLNGPYIILDRPQYQMWASILPIQLGGEFTKVKVTKDAAPPREKGAKPEEEVTFTVNATANAGLKKLSIDDQIPDGATLVEGSITGGGVAQGRRIKWNGTVSPLGGTYKVKLGKVPDLPRNPEALVSTVTAKATFDEGSIANDRANSFVPIIFPWRIKGQVMDIVFDASKSSDVRFPKTGGKLVELLNSSNAVVDSDTTDGGGRFRVFASDSGKYKLRVRGDVDNFDIGTEKIVPNGTSLEELREVEIAEADPDDKVFKQDVYLPVSLHNQVIKQVNALRTFVSLKYQFVLADITSVEIQGLIGKLVDFEANGRYNISPILSMLAKARANNFINSATGEKVYFDRLYREGDQQDGWNAVLRMSCFVEMLAKRQKSFAGFGQFCAKAISIAISSTVVAKSMPAIAKRNGWARPTDAQNLFGAAKVGTMAFGAGFILPGVLDSLGVTGAKKEFYMETISKVARYSLSAFALYLNDPGSLTGDLLFEVVFNVMRVGGTMLISEFYMLDTQQFLNSTCDGLAGGYYQGHTAQVLESMFGDDGDSVERSKFNLNRLADVDLRVLSLTRGLDGVLVKARSQTPTQWVNRVRGSLISDELVIGENGRPVIKDGEPVTSKGSGFATAVAVAIYGDVVLTTAYEWLFRQRELTSLSQLAILGTRPGETARTGGDRVRSLVENAPRGEVNSVVVDDYVDAIKDFKRIVVATGTAQYAQAQADILVFHQDFIKEIESRRNKVLAAAPGLEGKARKRAEAFINQTSGLFLEISLAYESVFMLLNEVGKKPDKTSASALDDLIKTIRKADARTSTVKSIVEGVEMPATLFIAPGNQPADATVLAGSNFTISLVVTNIGDSTSAAQTVRIGVGSNVTLVGATDQAVGALAPGQSLALNWTAKITATPNPSLVSYTALTLLGGSTVGIFTDAFLMVP